MRGGWCGPPRLALGSLFLHLPGSRLRMLGDALPWLGSGGWPTHGRGMQRASSSQGSSPGTGSEGPAAGTPVCTAGAALFCPEKPAGGTLSPGAGRALQTAGLRAGDPRALALAEWVWSPDSSPAPHCVLRPSASRVSMPLLSWGGLLSTLPPGAEFLEGRGPDSVSQVMLGLGPARGHRLGAQLLSATPGSCGQAQEQGPWGTCSLSPLSFHPTSLHPTPCSGSPAEAGTFQERGVGG